MVEYLDPVTLSTGERFLSRVKYFAYGVVSVELELPFESGWDELVRLSSRFILRRKSRSARSKLIRARLERVAAALVTPYSSWLNEDYYIIIARVAG